MSIKINVVLAYCTLCCFQYFLQSTLELDVSKYDYVYQAKNF